MPPCRFITVFPAPCAWLTPQRWGDRLASPAPTWIQPDPPVFRVAIGGNRESPAIAPEWGCGVAAGSGEGWPFSIPGRTPGHADECGHECRNRHDVSPCRVTTPGPGHLLELTVLLHHPPDILGRREQNHWPNNNMRPDVGLSVLFVNATWHPLIAYEALELDKDIPGLPAFAVILDLKTRTRPQAISRPPCEQFTLVTILNGEVPPLLVASHA